MKDFLGLEEGPVFQRGLVFPSSCFGALLAQECFEPHEGLKVMCYEQQIHAKARLGYTFHYFLSLFIFWLHHMAFRISALQPGMEPVLTVWKAWSLSHWTTGKSLPPSCSARQGKLSESLGGETDTILLLFHPSFELSLSVGPAKCRDPPLRLLNLGATRC